MSSHPPLELAALVRDKKVLVCCGAGGVGKTTTAAALALAGARFGRRVLVLTIDPARRLAQAMGIPANSRAPSPVDLSHLEGSGFAKGTLDAWMLNPDVVFESLVRELASSSEQAERILKNRLFRHLSELVSGMQEYTAAEALYTLSTSGKYDLVVLDTPPARNALDFLDAPGRLSRFLDERILNLFLPAQSRRLGLWKKATELIGNVFTRVFGSDFFEEMQQFLGAFGGMFGPMRRHAEAVRALLASTDSAFLLITSPEHAALTEAAYFRDRLLEMQLPFAGFVLNRSWAASAEADRSPLEAPADSSATLKSALEKLQGLAEIEQQRRARDQALLESLRSKVTASGLAVAAPYMGEAIEDVRGLADFAVGLTGVPEA